MEIINEYFAYLFTSVTTDVQYFSNWWMIFILPAIGWFIVLIIKYVILTIPITFSLRLAFGILDYFFGKPKYSRSDVEFAFEKGIHEGKLREHYKDNPTAFSESDLVWYMPKYKKKKK